MSCTPSATIAFPYPARAWLLGTIAFIGVCICLAIGWIGWGKSAKLTFLGIQYFVLLPAAWFGWRSGRHVDGLWSRVTPSLAVAIFCCMALPIALYFADSIYSGDESAYLFQARVFADGKLAADAPGRGFGDPNSPLKAAEVFQRVFRFQHHLIVDGKWFAKYPPGWPALLAPAVLFHLQALVNPLAGLGILCLTWRIGSLLFGTLSANLALLVLVASPFFTLNCVDYLSHASASFFLALAVYCLVLAWRAEESGAAGLRNRYLAAMLAALFALCLVRPFVAAGTGLVLGAGALWIVRQKLWNAILLFVLGVTTALGAVTTLLLYNKALTGSIWPHTFALYTHTPRIAEIEWLPQQIWKNFTDLTLVSIAETALSSFPFIFPLLLFAVWLEYRRSKIVLLLAALILSVGVSYLGQSFSSFSLIGERYYFEIYFLVALLGARGWILVWQRRRPEIANLLFFTVLLMQVFLYPAYVRLYVQVHRPSLQIMSAIRELRMRDAVVFLRNSGRLRAYDMNPNVASWSTAPAFLMKDPGADLRDDVACLLGRSQWIVIGYCDSQEKPWIGPTRQIRCRSVASR